MRWTIILVAALGANPAYAQIFSNSVIMGMGYTAQAGVSQQATLHCLRTDCSGRSARARTSVTPPVALAFRGGSAANGAAVQLRYASEPARQREAREAFIQRLQAKDPTAAQAVARESGKYNFAKIAGDLSGAAGLKPDDLADNLALYTAVGYLVANNDMSDPNPAVFRGLRNQLAPKLAADRRFASAAARAALGEELKFLTVILHAGWQSAMRENNLPAYSSGVARMFEQQGGSDLRSVRLTSGGFVPR